MKRILYIFLFSPLIGFSQVQVDCSSLSVIDVIMQNDSITYEIYNANTINIHFPYVYYTLDADGDTIQKSQMDSYLTEAESASNYSYTIYGLNFLPANLLNSINFPLSIYFTYSNLTCNNPVDYICELQYNPQMNIVNPVEKQDKIVVRKIDILGRDNYNIKNNVFIEIYDDGSMMKYFIID